MSLKELYRATRSLETIENYAASGFILPAENKQEFDDPQIVYCHSDEHFWDQVFNNRIKFNETVELQYFAVSEWVARIPGLFWTKNAEIIRNLSKGAVEYKSGKWNALEPLGKSQKVMGGIGTLKLPPDIEGNRLVSFSGGFNASIGIPVLITADIWDHHKLNEGRVINIAKGKWQSMSGTTWSDRFPSVKGIPKGFLIINNPDDLKPTTDSCPTLFHPCTVMEYSKNGSILYDFVYATADTSKKMHRGYIKEFFEQYKNDDERYGKYLLSADVEQPMWEAEFENPEALKRSIPGAKSQLELLIERVQTNSFANKNLDEILQILTNTYNNKDLKRISDDINIPCAIWFRDARVADAAADFLNVCVSRKKVEELIDKIAMEHPQLFT